MDFFLIASDQLAPALTLPPKEWYENGILLFVLTVAGLLISGAGLLFSWRAFQAALKAGHVVKIQDILIEVTELSEKSHLKSNVSFEQVSDLLHTLASRTNRVTTIFKELISTSDSQLISQLNSSFESARGKLDSLNPITNPGLNSPEQVQTGIIYYTMESEFSKIGQKLNTLKAVLEKNTSPGGAK